VLAWEEIADEENDLRLDEAQKRQLSDSVKKAERDIRETVWRTYKNVLLLGKDNTWKTIDLGLVHSSAAGSMVTLVLGRLRQDGDLEDAISPNFLLRNWPPAFKEWSTKSIHDAFFSSPQFPRLIKPAAIRETIARGVDVGLLAYAGKAADGRYDPFHWKVTLPSADIEITDQMYVVRKEDVETYLAGQAAPPPTTTTQPPPLILTPPGNPPSVHTPPLPPPNDPPPPVGAVHGLRWTGDIPPQKWMNFYTRVLSKFATAGSQMKLTLTVEVTPPDGISSQKVEETRVALRELGLKDDLD
jgi:hypothetical protein